MLQVKSDSHFTGIRKISLFSSNAMQSLNTTAQLSSMKDTAIPSKTYLKGVPILKEQTYKSIHTQ